MKHINKGLILLIIVSMGSCAIIMEPDLSDSEPILLAPADNTVTPTQTHTFWWDYVADAEKYNLLIVSPGFDSIARLVTDTNIAGNKFVGTLSPGRYQWGVSAYNHYSATPYTVYNITIDTLDGISYQTVRLSSPANNTSLNTSELVLAWEALEGAGFYLLDVRDSTWTIGNTIISSPRLTETKYSITLSEGHYSWGVSAYDDKSNTNTGWSTHNLLVDLTAPGKPIINSPSFNGDTLDTTPYMLKWSRPSPSLSAISDSIVVSSDSTFAEGSPTEASLVSSTEYSIAHLPDGKYFAKVKSIDAAGNEGAYSAVRNFILLKQE